MGLRMRWAEVAIKLGMRRGMKLIGLGLELEEIFSNRAAIGVDMLKTKIGFLP